MGAALQRCSPTKSHGRRGGVFHVEQWRCLGDRCGAAVLGRSWAGSSQGAVPRGREEGFLSVRVG